MAKHTALLGLLTLMFCTAAVHVTADVTGALATVEDLTKAVAGVKASLGGKSDRSDIRACYKTKSLTCAYPTSCSSSKCQCCPCACATLTCSFILVKNLAQGIAAITPQVTTPAQRKAVSQTFCDAARATGPVVKDLVRRYRTIKCPGQVGTIKSLNAYQANLIKSCKAFGA